jgi:transcriptional regulator with XRE-family HTH domain
MFWENFVTLCNKKGKSPNGACAELGFSANTATKWKQGSVPRDTTLRKIADYFGVSVSYLIGAIDDPDPIALINPEKKEPPLLPLVQELGQQLEALAALGGLVDQLTDEQVAELRRYAEFLVSNNKEE